jgi:hypothetical protein
MSVRADHPRDGAKDTNKKNSTQPTPSAYALLQALNVRLLYSKLRENHSSQPTGVLVGHLQKIFLLGLEYETDDNHDLLSSLVAGKNFRGLELVAKMDPTGFSIGPETVLPHTKLTLVETLCQVHCVPAIGCWVSFVLQLDKARKPQHQLGFHGWQRLLPAVATILVRMNKAAELEQLLSLALPNAQGRRLVAGVEAVSQAFGLLGNTRFGRHFEQVFLSVCASTDLNKAARERLLVALSTATASEVTTLYQKGIGSDPGPGPGPGWTARAVGERVAAEVDYCVSAFGQATRESTNLPSPLVAVVAGYAFDWGATLLRVAHTQREALDLKRADFLRWRRRCLLKRRQSALGLPDLESTDSSKRLR